jgi:nucleotide-binding universal stress UspA family protein
LVAVRHTDHLQHLRRTLQKTNLKRTDVVVMTVREVTPDSEYDLNADQVFGPRERALFTTVVSVAEKEGKSVELLVVPSRDPLDAIVQTATRLKASRIVMGISAQLSSEDLARRVGLAWENLPEPRNALSLEVICPDRPSTFVNLGPHPPRLWPEDVERLHTLWLDIAGELGSTIHHRDVVGFALQQLQREISDGNRNAVLDRLKVSLHH